MKRKTIVCILLLAVLFCGCVNKKTAESESNTENNTTADEINNPGFPINEKVYVGSFDGLNLRSNYGINGERIKLLPHNTELTVLERSEEKETIDKINDYWYKVDTGNEMGWVFGGYLFHKSLNDKIMNVDEKAGIPETTTYKTTENFDWLTEYGWSLEDGRRLVDPSVGYIDWIGFKTPIALFEIFNIPSDCVLYQVKPSWDLFYFLYQTEEKNKLYPIGSAHGTEVYDLEFGENHSHISLRSGDRDVHKNRVGQQLDPDYPLVGIWGKLPALDEYRLIDPANCVFYMEIKKEIPGYAVRRGTYIFYKTGYNRYETISSFPDGRMKLEVKDKNTLILTPLYTLPEGEEGWVAPLILSRHPFPKSELVEED